MIYITFKGLSVYLLRTALCDLGTGHGLAWCSLAYGCSYISTGLVLQVPSVPPKSNFYLLNTS